MTRFPYEKKWGLKKAAFCFKLWCKWREKERREDVLPGLGKDLILCPSKWQPSIYYYFFALFITFSNSAHHTYSCIGTSGKNCQNPHEGVLVKTTAESIKLDNNIPSTLKALFGGFFWDLISKVNFWKMF